MKIRCFLYKDHYENNAVKPASCFFIMTTMKIRVSNMHRVLYKDDYENTGVKPVPCFI